MNEKFGYAVDTWEKAKEEIRRILIETAKRQNTIAYSVLVGKLQTVTLEPDSYTLKAMLGEISTEEDAAGRGMLSVVVVHKEGDRMPGSGFYELAKQLGRRIRDKDEFWLKELNTVYSSWKADP